VGQLKKMIERKHGLAADDITLVAGGAALHEDGTSVKGERDIVLLYKVFKSSDREEDDEDSEMKKKKTRDAVKIKSTLDRLKSCSPLFHSDDADDHSQSAKKTKTQASADADAKNAVLKRGAGILKIKKPEESKAASVFAVDQEKIVQLTNMGFSENSAKRALAMHRNILQAALNWLLEESDNPRVNDEISESDIQELSNSNRFIFDEASLDFSNNQPHHFFRIGIGEEMSGFAVLRNNQNADSHMDDIEEDEDSEGEEDEGFAQGLPEYYSDEDSAMSACDVPEEQFWAAHQEGIYEDDEEIESESDE
jgi:hypothetical protein